MTAIIVHSLETPTLEARNPTAQAKCWGARLPQVCQATRSGICGLLTAATHGWLPVAGYPGLDLIRGTLEGRLEMHPLGQRGSKWPRLVVSSGHVCPSMMHPCEPWCLGLLCRTHVEQLKI